ncbi:MAG TPA: hypothetical protein VEN81_03425, partial [Planctomycetota bacterium]|nr:hypothetical protein [Planctomycetota bacterium]
MRILAALILALLGTPQTEPKKDPVNLISLIDADLDSVVGDWSVQGGKLGSPKRSRPPRMHLLQIPYVPPEEYDLTLVIESKGPFDPKGDTTSVDFGLPWGEIRPAVVLDGWDGTVRGLSLIDGKNASENETTGRTRIFTDGTPHTVVCSVRKAGIAVTVDGKSILDWKGEAKRLSSDWTYRDLPDKRTPFLAAWIGYVFHKIELSPVTGAGTPIAARRSKSRLVGGGGGADFDDTPPRSALLVGLKYSTAPWGQDSVI